MTPARAAGIGGRSLEPAGSSRLEQIAAGRREIVAEVIRDHTFHRQGEPDTFPCPSSLYLSRSNEPHVDGRPVEGPQRLAGPGCQKVAAESV